MPASVTVTTLYSLSTVLWVMEITLLGIFSENLSTWATITIISLKWRHLNSLPYQEVRMIIILVITLPLTLKQILKWRSVYTWLSRQGFPEGISTGVGHKGMEKAKVKWGWFHSGPLQLSPYRGTLRCMLRCHKAAWCYLGFQTLALFVFVDQSHVNVWVLHKQPLRTLWGRDFWVDHWKQSCS